MSRPNSIVEVCTTIASPAMQEKIRAALPDGVSLDRFTRVTLTAIQQNPDITTKDRTSLYNACVKCAADGLLPDGREAALVAYGSAVQYMPMIGGIIKRLAQSGIVIDAQLVHENDEFEQILGDDARIVHKAPKLGQQRGDIVGVYAIAKLPNGLVMREVMDRDQVEQVRAVSRAAKSGPWVQWWGEMARKTVTRRLAKRLPILDPAVRDLITADDDQFDFEQTAAPAPAQAAQEPAGRPRALAAVVARGAAQPAAQQAADDLSPQIEDGPPPIEPGEGDVF